MGTSDYSLNSKFMAQFWIAIFFILLAVAQLFQSIKDLELPFTVYLVLGTVLAVASNARNQFSFTQNERVAFPVRKAADPVPNSVDDLDPPPASLIDRG
jgi:hypothetical protein